MDDDQFQVSRDLLKTITVDTRVAILKSLEDRPMTASELSRFLDKHVTTVTEHLDLLKNSNLVERVERPGRKWIYYKLTREGKKILHPESYRLVMILSTVFIIILAGFFLLTVDFHPGSYLYGVKTGRESIQLALATNSIERAKMHLEIAGNKLAEAKDMADQGKNQDVKNLISDYENEMNQTEVEINNSYNQTNNTIEVLETLTEVTPEYVSVLENILVKFPELKGDIQLAINASIKIQENAASNLQTMTGKPYLQSMSKPLC